MASCVLWLLGLACLGGCGSGPKVAEDQNPSEPAAMAALQASETEVAAPSEPDPVAEESPDAVVPESVDPAVPESAPARTDGRPEWWADRPAFEVERVWVCAEALGRGMSDAKEAALRRGRAELRKLLLLNESAPIPGEVVERTSVRPLPSKGGDHSFAGYVLISAEMP